MTEPRVNTGRVVLKILPLLLAPIAFLSALPWLRQTVGGQAVGLIAIPVALFVLGYANYLSFRWQRRLDEVHQASSGFAAQWGMPMGQAAFVLLILLPPFQQFATAFVIDNGDPGPGSTVDRSVVIFAMTMGFCAVVLLQAVGTMVVSALWWRSKQGPPGPA